MSNESEAPEPAKKLVYPFPIVETSSGDERNTAEATDPQAYYDALALAEDGFYPIGYNGQWHGGIHFGSQTGTQLAQDEGVRCIADGEVIAWKIDDDYPTVEYDTCGAATYSTGFVLVRHRLQLPRADRAQVDGADEAANANQGGNEARQEPSLVFYSLYMHLLYWKGYQQDADKARPAFWGDPVYLVGEGANDADHARNPHIPEGGVGLNLRDAANNVVGFAPRGTQLRLGERRGTSGYYAVSEVVSGALVPPGLTGAYAFRDELTPMPVEPPTRGEIVIPDEPIAIAAGDPVGHLGQYQRYIDMNPLGASCNARELVQVDVFATEDVEAFVRQSRERAAQLADRHKTLLLIDRGARLVRAPRGEGQPTAEQLTAQAGNADGPEVAHPRVIPVKALGEAVTEEDGTRWWNVEAGNNGGESVWGWVRERDQTNVRLCTPWDWPGFEIVKIDDTRPDQFYANQVVRQGHAAPDERGDLEQRGQGAEMGPLFRKLYDMIDLDDDKTIISSEMRQALAKPWLAQAISHLIVEHESEWSGPMDKWDDIDELIPEQRNKDWEKEKERIESLLWWGDAKDNHGLPNDEPLIAYNFHPVGFVANFKRRGVVTVEMLRRVFPNAPEERLRIVAEGVNMNLEEGRIDSEERITHFFGQVRQEVGTNMAFREDLRYSSDGLYNSDFSYYRGNRARSDRDARNEEAIANNAYADANRSEGFRLGNTQPGDGWRYRGRGLKQLTGRDNYREFTTSHERIWGEQVDFEADPDRVDEPIYAVRSALAFWVERRLYLHADAGVTQEAADNITRVINRRTSSYAARWGHVQRIWQNRIFRDAF